MVPMSKKPSKVEDEPGAEERFMRGIGKALSTPPHAEENAHQIEHKEKEREMRRRILHLVAKILRLAAKVDGEPIGIRKSAFSSPLHRCTTICATQPRR